MKMRSCFLILLFLGSRVSAQAVLPPGLTGPAPPVHAPVVSSESVAVWNGAQTSGAREAMASNRNFPNFIGFMSNPLQNIDPRSLTQVVPIFGSAWVGTGRALPDLDGQIYGPASSFAITDRFSVGLNQGGLAFVHIERNDARFPLINRVLRNRGAEFGGTRQGFLNLGGFAQYTFIEDVENQFLATAGVRVTVPCGSYELFQGTGPALLSPYLTVGKEIGNFHMLATGGYQFPARSGYPGTDLFYLNAHLDRQCFGWVYPLVEVNWSYHTSSVDVALPTRRGIIDFGNFESNGNVVTVGAGVNLVLIRDRLELGAVYTRAVSTKGNIDIDGLIVKMVIRY